MVLSKLEYGEGSPKTKEFKNLYNKTLYLVTKKQAEHVDRIFYHQLGLFKLIGFGTEKSVKTAADYFKISMAAGHRDSAFRYAEINREGGEDFKPNILEAVKYYYIGSLIEKSDLKKKSKEMFHLLSASIQPQILNEIKLDSTVIAEHINKRNEANPIN